MRRSRAASAALARPASIEPTHQTKRLDTAMANPEKSDAVTFHLKTSVHTESERMLPTALKTTLGTSTSTRGLNIVSMVLQRLNSVMIATEAMRLQASQTPSADSQARRLKKSSTRKSRYLQICNLTRCLECM